jgi:hypothetical protein
MCVVFLGCALMRADDAAVVSELFSCSLESRGRLFTVYGVILEILRRILTAAIISNISMWKSLANTDEEQALISWTG